LERVLMDIFLS